MVTRWIDLSSVIPGDGSELSPFTAGEFRAFAEATSEAAVTYKIKGKTTFTSQFFFANGTSQCIYENWEGFPNPVIEFDGNFTSLWNYASGNVTIRRMMFSGKNRSYQSLLFFDSPTVLVENCLLYQESGQGPLLLYALQLGCIATIKGNSFINADPAGATSLIALSGGDGVSTANVSSNYGEGGLYGFINADKDRKSVV